HRLRESAMRVRGRWLLAAVQRRPEKCRYIVYIATALELRSTVPDAVRPWAAVPGLRAGWLVRVAARTAKRYGWRCAPGRGNGPACAACCPAALRLPSWLR